MQGIVGGRRRMVKRMEEVEEERKRGRGRVEEDNMKEVEEKEEK